MSETPCLPADVAPPSVTVLADLGPVAQLRAGRLPRRLVQLAAGLWLYGVSLAMMVRGDLGLAPWDVLHSGLARMDLGLAPWDVLHSGLARMVPLSLGQVLIVTSFVVLLAWIPLREVPGIGTVANALVVGVAADTTLALLDRPDALAGRIALMVGGVLLCGFATSFYIGAQLGRGPRDGLMTGLHRRTGLSLRLVRTALEVAVVLLGLCLGGSLGIGTVLFALAIGPVAQALLPLCLVDLSPSRSGPFRRFRTRAARG